MTIALNAFNSMQQTDSISLNNIPSDITAIYVIYFQTYYFLMQYFNSTMGCQKTFKKIGL